MDKLGTQATISKIEAEKFPLPTLLSQALVAFTIEFDNEAERQMHRADCEPWLASQVFWANYLRFIGDDGLTVQQLLAFAGHSATDATFDGIRRWGYVTIEPDSMDSRAKPPHRDWIIRLTRAGRMARQVWEPLAVAIEQRWWSRFGEGEIDRLRAIMESLALQIKIPLPNYLPVVSIDMVVDIPQPVLWRSAQQEGCHAAKRDLSALLAYVLLAFTLQFEGASESKVSLTMCADLLRVLNYDGVRQRDLPRLAGVSKEAISMMQTYLVARGITVVEVDPGDGKTKLIRLTQKGKDAQETYHRLLASIEQDWEARFGSDVIAELRQSLGQLLCMRNGDQSRLGQGLVPAPGCWRGRKPYLAQTTAMIQDPVATLPHHPMILHRGGYPDGV